MEVPATSTAGTFFMATQRRLPRVVLAISAAALAAATVAQPPASALRAAQPPAGTRIETRHLTLNTSVSPDRAGRALLHVDVVLKPKMHVYAPDQPKDQDYMPIALAIEKGDAYRLEKPRYPASEKFFFAPLKETQHVYSKAFRITQPVTLSKTATGDVVVKGSVRYQACDDAICYIPQTVPVTWIVPRRTTAAPKSINRGEEIRKNSFLKKIS